MQTIAQKAIAGAPVAAKAQQQQRAARAAVVVPNQLLPQTLLQVDRRAALGLLAAAAAVTTAQPSEAAYGDAARVFAGKVTNKSGFVPYAVENFAVLIPSKWNPSKEQEFPGTVLRYEDNGAAANNLVVLVQKVGKNSIEDLGSPDKFLQDNAYLLGESAAFTGSTLSEGGFLPNKVAAASVLDVQEVTDKKGKKYYKYEVLTRTADGEEGGRHQLVAATVSQGNLYLLLVRCGDKRWFKGADKVVKGTWDSFTVV